jgi:hypothetical protein
MLSAAVAAVRSFDGSEGPVGFAAPLIFLRKFRRRVLQNRSGPYGSTPGKKSRRAVLHCGMSRADLARRDKLRKKMPPSVRKAAPISRVDPALFVMSPSGARMMLNNARPAWADNSLIDCVLSSNPTGGLCRHVIFAARLFGAA